MAPMNQGRHLPTIPKQNQDAPNLRFIQEDPSIINVGNKRNLGKPVLPEPKIALKNAGEAMFTKRLKEVPEQEQRKEEAIEDMEKRGNDEEEAMQEAWQLVEEYAYNNFVFNMHLGSKQKGTKLFCPRTVN